MEQRDAFNDLLVDLGYGWVASDLAATDAGSDREYFREIIRTIDRDLAQGSETPLLGDALNADGFDDNPVACLGWWLDAYRAWELVDDRDDGIRELVAEAIFSGRSDDALALVRA